MSASRLHRVASIPSERRPTLDGPMFDRLENDVMEPHAATPGSEGLRRPYAASLGESSIPELDRELLSRMFADYRPLVPPEGLRTDRAPTPEVPCVPSGIRETVTDDGVTVWSVTVYAGDGP